MDSGKPTPESTLRAGAQVPLVDVGTQDLSVQRPPEGPRILAWDMDPLGEVVGFEGLASDRQIIPPAMVQPLAEEGVAANYPPTLRTLRLMPFTLGMSDSDRVRFFLELVDTKRNPDSFLVTYLSMGLKPMDYRNHSVVGRISEALYDLENEPEEMRAVLLPLARVAMVRAFEYGASHQTKQGLEDLLDSMNRAEGTYTSDHWPYPKGGHPAVDLAMRIRGRGPSNVAPEDLRAFLQLARVSHLAFEMVVRHVALEADKGGSGLGAIAMKDALEAIAAGIRQRGQGSTHGAGEVLLRGAWLHQTSNSEIALRARRLDETDLGHFELRHLDLVKTVLTKAGLPALDPAWMESREEDDERPDGTALIKEALEGSSVPFSLLPIHRRAVVVGMAAMLERGIHEAAEVRQQKGILPPRPRQLPWVMEGLFLAAGAYGMQEAAEALSRQMSALQQLGWSWVDVEPHED